MAETAAQKKARLAEESKVADSKVFGAPTGDAPTDPVPPAQETGAVQNAPTPPVHTPMQQTDGVTISREQFETMMTRMADLETIAMSASRPSDASSVFNPLSEVKEDRILHVVFHGDLLVTGYKEIVKPNGSIHYTWQSRNETGMIRTYVTLLLTDIETGDVSEEVVDLLEFLEGATPMAATIKERKDIGGVVEHGLVTQMRWDGKSLVPTDSKVMTGARIQKFLFTVEFAGKRYQLTEQVVNIKS